MKDLDFSKFKKISSDAKCTTLQHGDGHTIKIAHAPLSKKLRGDLDKLPMCDGGKVQKFAYGSPSGVQPGDDPVADDSQAQGSYAGAETKPYDVSSGMAAQFMDRIKNNQPLIDMRPQKVAMREPIPDQGMSPQGVPNALLPNEAVNQQQDEAKEEPTLADQQPQKGDAAPASIPQASSKSDESSAPVASQPQPAQQQAPAPAPTPEQQIAVDKNKYAAEDQAWAHDLQNGHVTPETYQSLYAKKDTLGKIGTIFGLMLGGAGSGLSGQPNALLEMMNKQINNDLEAQKSSKTNAQNFNTMNYNHQVQMAQVQQMGVQNQLSLTEAKIKADTLSHMQMNRAALHSMVMAVNKMPVGSPQRAQAEQTLAMMSNAVDGMNANLGDLAAGKQAYARMLFGNQAGGSDEQNFQKQMSGMRMLGPQGETRAKDLEAKHFPGIKGQASRELNSADNEQIESGIEFDQKLHRFMDWTKNHSGDLSPTDKNQGQALASELQGSYRQASNGGVYKEGEQHFISKLIDSEPTKFFNSVRVMPQLKAIASEHQKKMNQIVKSKGFDGYEGSQSAPDQQYKIVGGVKYMRGPDGQAIKVK